MGASWVLHSFVFATFTSPINCCFQQDCEYDSLSLSSKLGSGEIRKHGVFCGSRLPPVITSEGNSLRLEFNSDNSVQKSGFAAVFFTGEFILRNLACSAALEILQCFASL